MKITTIQDNLKSLFEPKNLLNLARKTGFIKRLRQLSPLHLVGAIVQTLGSQPNANLADIHRALGALSGTMPNYKPFHNQLKKPSLTKLLETLVKEATKCWLLQPFQEALPDKYPFKKIHLHDGSSLKLHSALAGTFPGRFKKSVPAAIELHLTMDLIAGTANYLAIDADKESERLYNPYADELNNTLILMDAGYFNISYCYQVNENGGYYIIRSSNSINPDITEAFTAHGAPVKGLQGKKLRSLKLRQDQQLDLTVKWCNRPGHYRLIAFWDRRKSCIGYLITNLSREEFSVEDICNLYGLRWQVELFFKELKSYCNLSTFNTRNEHIVKTLVWGSMLVLLMKRYIAFGTGLLKQILISTQKVARCSLLWMNELVRALLEPETLEKTLRQVTEYLAIHGQRAHSKRDKQTLLLQLGLGLYPVLD